MTLRPTFTRPWLALLLVLSAAVFTLGVAVERSTVHTDTHATATARSSGETSREHSGSSETSGERSGEGSAQHAESTSSGETLFGVNTESTGLVVAAIAVSLALAIAVWLFDLPWLFLLVVAFGLGAAIFDAREVEHQVQESQGTLAVLAALTTLLHAGVDLVAWRLWHRPSHQTTSAMVRA